MVEGKQGQQFYLIPYVPYATWERFLGRLTQAMPLPKRLDSSFWAGLRFSGSMQSALKTCLKALDLMEEDGSTRPELEQLVKSEGESRQELLRRLVERTYAPLLEQTELERATLTELHEYFRKFFGASGEMGDKCRTFFINLAKDAGFKLHPHLLARVSKRGHKGKWKKDAIKQETLHKTSTATIEGIALPELLVSLLKLLPETGRNWAEKEQWKQAFDAAFSLLYSGQVELPRNQHSESTPSSH